MYNNRTNYILVGGFVIAMLAAAGVSLAVLTGRTGPTDRYFVSLDNVADIKYGTQVRFEGFPIGQVEGIEPGEPGETGRFRIEISVRQAWRIPADSVTRIGSSSFLAAKTLDIESGQSEETIDLGGTISSAAPEDIFATMSGAANQLTALSEGSIRPLLKTMQSLASTVERDTPRITDELITFSRRLNESLTPIQSILADQNIQAIQRAIANTEGTTETLSAASQDLAVAMINLRSLTSNLDSLVEASDASVEQTLLDLSHTLASVARSVDTIVYNFDGTARNMNEFSRVIRSNPGVLLGGSPRKAVSQAKVSEVETGQ